MWISWVANELKEGWTLTKLQEPKRAEKTAPFCYPEAKYLSYQGETGYCESTVLYLVAISNNNYKDFSTIRIITKSHELNKSCSHLVAIGSLSSDVFEQRTSSGSESFFFLICLDATKIVLLRVFSLYETVCPRICSKSQTKSAKTPLPVDVRGSKTWLL